MKQLIDELKEVSGVIGACVYSSTEGILVTNLPRIFKLERLTLIGNKLARLLSAGQMSFDDLIDISLYYDESVLVVRGAGKERLIIVVCDHDHNQNLLSMSLNLLQEEVVNGEYTDEDEPMGVISESVAVAEVIEAQPEDHQMRQAFEEMKRKLGKILGPMAGIIFDEAVLSWELQGPANRSRVDSLLDLVNSEIGDSSKVEDYSKLIVDDLAKLT